MKSIEISDRLYEQLMKQGINIEEELNKLIQRYYISKDEIAKAVRNSQRIEGYEVASPEVKSRVKVLMEKHNAKVSLV